METEAHPSTTEVISINKLLELRAECANDHDCAVKLTENSSYSEGNFDSLRRKIKTVSEKVKSLKTKKSKNLHVYLESDFLPPEEKTGKLLTEISDGKQKQLAEKIVAQTKCVVEENRNLKRQYNALKNDNTTLEEQVGELSKTLEEAVSVLTNIGAKHDQLVLQNNESVLRNELEESRLEFEKQSSTVAKISTELKGAQQKLSKYNPRNVNKKLKRRDEAIEKMKSKLRDVEAENVNIRKELARKCEENENVQHVKEDKHTVQKHVSKLKKKVQVLKEKNAEMKNTHEDDIFSMNQKLECNKKEIYHLKGVVEIMECDMISTFCDGRYTDEVRECCMNLMAECNVSLSKLPEVIRVVLSSFTGKVPERLPSKTLLNWLMAEAKVVAAKHVASEMVNDLQTNLHNNVGNVLHQDATTKFHQHFEGAQVTLADGRNLTVGLKQVAGGDGQTYFQAFREMVKDLASSFGTNENEKKSAELVCSIKHFMSDQCATNGVFNSAVEELRQELLPAVCDKYDQMNDEEKTLMTDMGKFACRLHLLANFGTDADKALAGFEDSISEGNNPFAFKGGESGTFRLCRTAAKAFTKRGSDKAGVNSYWEAYLKGTGGKNHLVTFKGHRINIAFHEGAAVYHHRHDISNFLKDWPDPNGLLKSINFDIKETGYLAGCRALGIFDKLVTGPFWRILEEKGSILDLNEDIQQLQLTLSHWAENGSIPFSGENMFGDRAPIKKDNLYDSLFKDSASPSEDALTIMALELLSAQLLLLLERQAKTQLPDGQYFSPSDEFRQSAVNVPKTNTVSERDMAVLDNLLRAKPSASALTLEVIVMCAKNKPFKWLRTLTTEERMKVLDDARKQGKGVKEEFKARKRALERKVEEKLKQKKAKVEQREQKEINMNFNISREISKYGGPWTENEIEEKEITLADEYRNALLCQIRFHRHVLKSKGKRELYQETVNRRKYSTEELKENLRTIIQMNEVKSEECEISAGLQYKDTEDSRNEINDRKKKLTAELMKARQKRKIEQQKTQLEKYLKSPENLVGKRVHHKCVEGLEHVWFRAKVESIYTEKENKMKTEYNIIYDEEPDASWHFPLLIDMKNGDLLVEDL